jgi:hypothetical protein
MVIGDYGAAHRKAGNEHEKNTELIRTETNSDSMSSYGVRTSSLLIFFIPGRKEGKAQPQFRTRTTRIARIFTDTANPRASASTVAPVDVAHTYGSRHKWRSVFHHVCSSLKSPASGTSVSAFICVHLRFFIDVIFQTGLTGSTGYVFNPVHPVILSDLKCQLLAPRQRAMVEVG